jgi:hypothetical protein
VPGATVLGRGIVTELGWSELMTDKGTAVGLVASNEKVATGVDADGVPVTAGVDGTETEAAGVEAAGTDGAGVEVAWDTEEEDDEGAAGGAWRAW